MKKIQGFTLIEILLLIIVTGILASTIMLSINTASVATPALLQDAIAQQAAKQCMEWLIGQRRLNGYNSVTCPSTTVPAFCTAPSGFTVSVNVVCTTLNGDANYETVTVSISGKGSASLSTLLADY